MTASLQGMPSVADAVASLMERGYCVLPALLADADRREACALLDMLVERHGLGDSHIFGYGIHPLCTRESRLCRFFAHPLITAVCEACVQDRIWLAHTGARVSDPRHGQAGARIGWHNHQFSNDLRRPDNPALATLRGVAPTRLLYGWYLDGSNDETGPLIAVPRRFDDPLKPPSGAEHASWAGEQDIHAPPGSAIIFSIDLWHTAAAGRGGTRRHLMGAHVQARRDGRPHPEDHCHTGASIDAGSAACPAFAELVNKT